MYQMPNIWHNKHKKPPRCSKSYYFCHMWTVPSQICHYMDSCGISFYYFFIPLSLSSLRQSHPQTPILSSQAPLYLSISHSLFLSAPLPCSALAPPYSPRRWRLPPRSPPSEIRSRGSSPRFLLRLQVHQDRAWESNCLPARRWRESDFQHNQADDRVDRLGQGGDRAWVGVLDCWGDL